MNIFIDTEFTCLPWESRSEIISIGIYCENGCKFYACFSDFDQDNLSPFVKDNVIPQLPGISKRKPKHIISTELTKFFSDKKISSVWATFPTLEQLKTLYKRSDDIDKIYQKYADWDFQLLQSLLNPIPEVFPESCENVTPYYLTLSPEEIPINKSAHDALQDAIWNYKVWKIAYKANSA